jgi:hypothetical protein
VVAAITATLPVQVVARRCMKCVLQSKNGNLNGMYVVDYHSPTREYGFKKITDFMVYVVNYENDDSFNMA